jgi:hypothetical protein
MISKIAGWLTELVDIVASFLCSVIYRREGGYRYWRNIDKGDWEKFDD